MSHRLGIVCLLMGAVFFAFASPLRAEDLTADTTNLVKATLIADAEAVTPGSEFKLGIHLKMKPHWHTYWINPGETGEATKIKITGPAGFEFGAVQWPLPLAIESFGAITYGYEDEVLLIVPVKVGKDVAVGKTAEITAHVAWLACYDTCIEGEAKLITTVGIIAKGQQTSATNAASSTAQFNAWLDRVPKNSSAAIKSIEQGKTGATIKPEITVHWNQAVKKVDWYPISTRAVAIENVSVKHQGKHTEITYKPTVYKAEQVPGGKVDGVVVFEDAKGQRQGVLMSISVPLE